MRKLSNIHMCVQYVPSGALIMISAPVSLFPQRNSPLLGEVASWDSRKSNMDLRFGFRYLDSMAPVIRRASGRMRKGVDVLMSGKYARCELGCIWGVGEKLGGGGLMGWKRRTAHQQGNHQKPHHAPFGEMHEIPIPHPRFRLFSHSHSHSHSPFFLSLPTTCVPLRHHAPRAIEMLEEILDDEPRFRKYQWL